MKRRYFLLLWFVIIIIGIVVSIATKNSYKSNNLEDYNLNEFSVMVMNLEFSGTNNDINTYQKLKDNSNYILIASLVEKQEQQRSTVVSKMKVEKVLKGDNAISNQIINVFEPNYFDFERKQFVSAGCSDIINNKNNYLLYLKKTQSQGTTIYYFTTKSVLSEYHLGNSKINEKVISNGDTIKYSDIKNSDIISTDEKDILLYRNFRKQSFNDFKIK